MHEIRGFTYTHIKKPLFFCYRKPVFFGYLFVRWASFCGFLAARDHDKSPGFIALALACGLVRGHNITVL
jgi:hypothetical protein